VILFGKPKEPEDVIYQAMSMLEKSAKGCHSFIQSSTQGRSKKYRGTIQQRTGT